MIDVAPLLSHRRGVLIVFILLVMGTAPGLLHLRVDNSPEGFLTRDAEALEQLETLERSFGRDRGVRLLVAGEGLWTHRGLAWLEELERRAEAPGGVYGAAGPISHHRWHLDVPPATQPEAFARLVQRDELDRQAGWVSTDGDMITVMAGLYEMVPSRRQATLRELERALVDAPPGVKTGLVGIPEVNQALDDAQMRMAALFFPLLLAAGVVLLWLFFRSASGILLPLALVGVCEIVLLGCMGYSGQRFDVVTILLVPLIFVISTATAVHVLAYHRRQTAHDAVARVRDTYRDKAWAVLWTGLTTAAGFGSLVISGVPAVQSLGLWAAFGIVFMTVTALSFYPALLAAASGIADRSSPARGVLDERIGQWAGTGAGWAVANRQRVGLAFALIALLAAIGITRLEIESNVLEYFQPQHPTRAGLEALEARGIGGVSASLVLEREGGFADASSLERLRRLSEELRAENLVLGSIGLGDLAANVDAYRLDTHGPVVDFMMKDRDLNRLRAFLLYRDGTRSRIVLSTAMRGWEDLGPVYRRATATAEGLFPEAEIYVTGQYPLILEGQRSLLWTIVTSLGLTLLVIATILALLVGNASLALRALVPNLWPVLIVLGLMGWMGVPVDSATVMIASVVLGLAVDDTLHILAHFRRYGSVQSPAAAIQTTLRETGAGLAVTSVILVTGFGVVSLSSLVPVSHFGTIASLAVAASLAADLWLVPALFAGVRPSRAWKERARKPG